MATRVPTGNQADALRDNLETDKFSFRSTPTTTRALHKRGEMRAPGAGIAAPSIY